MRGTENREAKVKVYENNESFSDGNEKIKEVIGQGMYDKR